MALSICPSISGDSLPVNAPANTDYSLKEPVVGTQLFPAAIYEDNITTVEVAWHWHEEFEIGFITDGTVYLQTGSHKHTLHKGDVFFINSGIIHSMKNADPGNPSVLKALVFHGSIIGGNENSIFHQRYILPFLKSSQFRNQIFTDGNDFTHNAFFSVQRIWSAMYEAENGYELYVRNELSSFFELLLTCADVSSSTDSDAALKQEHRAKIMLDFIHCHYSENITLEKMANEAYISVSEALRCFKNIIGISPIQYLKNYRLQQAAHYLKSTGHSISRICELCGFSDHSYFTKAFKAVYHCTPHDYRTGSVSDRLARHDPSVDPALVPGSVPVFL